MYVNTLVGNSRVVKTIAFVSVEHVYLPFPAPFKVTVGKSCVLFAVCVRACLRYARVCICVQKTIDIAIFVVTEYNEQGIFPFLFCALKFYQVRASRAFLHQ